MKAIKPRSALLALLAAATLSTGAYAQTVTYGDLSNPSGAAAGSLDDGVSFIQTISAAPTTGDVNSFEFLVTGNSGAAGGFNIPGYSYNVPIDIRGYLAIFTPSTAGSGSITSVLYASPVTVIPSNDANTPLTFSGVNTNYSLAAGQQLALVISDYNYTPGSTTEGSALNTDNPFDNSGIAYDYNNRGAYTTTGNANLPGAGNIFGTDTTSPAFAYHVTISAATPEPSSYALVIAGFAALLFLRLRSRQS